VGSVALRSSETRTPKLSRSVASSVRNMVSLAVLALLPVVLLAASSIRLASKEVSSEVDKQVQTTAAISAVVIGQQVASLELLVQSYATRPTLVAGVAGGALGGALVQLDLASLAHAVPGISGTFVASTEGTSLATYPVEPGVIGKNLRYQDWYKGLVASGRAFASNAVETREVGHPPAMTVTDYIRGPNGRPIGILGANYLLGPISSFSASLGRAEGITLTVTDRLGTSLTARGSPGLVSLTGDPGVREALEGRSGLLEYAAVLPDGGHGPKEMSAYTPVVGTGWAVVASIPKSVAFAGLARLRDVVLSIAAVLVLILLAGVGAITRSDRRRRGSELELQSRDRLARVLESTDEAFVSVDDADAITAWNGRAQELYGWAAPDVLGRNFADSVVPAVNRDAYRGDLAAYRAGSSSGGVGKRVETTALHHDGHEIPVEMGVWAHDAGNGFSSFAHEITERVSGRARLSRQALTDELTGLANRFALLEVLEARLGFDDVLIFADLDHFKIVNDSLGHEAGDGVIAETGRRLLQVTGGDDLVARLGGDEFALVLRGPRTKTEVADCCEAILEVVRQPYEILVDGAMTRSQLGVSLGVTCLSGHAASTSGAMREADLALYRAKGAGRQRFVVFDESLRRDAQRRLDREGTIRSALDGGRFVAYLSPIVALMEKVVLGHEIMLRLEQDEVADELPFDLMEVAAESNLITEVDKLTLRTAVRLLSGEPGFPGIVNIKVSARTIQHPGFADTMANVALELGAGCHRLGLELSERVLVVDEQAATAAIDVLHAAGFRVGLDRFGRGGLPLANLGRLKLDFLKIDRSFIDELSNDEDAARSVLRVLFQIGAAFDLKVIAEGIDTPLQAEKLLELGCHSGQGEFLGGARNASAGVTMGPPAESAEGCSDLTSPLATVADRRVGGSRRGR
jgi:diguanylate cyclase (GGDEF)-like protein/PAS domain S-box-containing protein